MFVLTLREIDEVVNNLLSLLDTGSGSGELFVILCLQSFLICHSNLVAKKVRNYIKVISKNRIAMEQRNWRLSLHLFMLLDLS